MGHLIPLVELTKRLVTCHNLNVTFIIPTTTDAPPSAAMKSVLDSLPSASVDTIFPPPVSLNDFVLNPSAFDAKIETIIPLPAAQSLPPLRDAFRSIATSGRRRLSALVVDLFGTDAFDVAAEFGAASYVFYPSTAMALSLFLYLPTLDAEVTGAYSDLDEPVQIPGCIPVNGTDLLDPVQDRNNDAYSWLLHHAKRYRLADGVMVNSFPELEPGAIKSLQKTEDQLGKKPMVYPVGPLVNMDSSKKTGSECLDWLDVQPSGSVLFVSFGSGGTLSYDQINELAFGLEMSEQRFIWVVRSPDDKTANASFFTVQSQNDPFHFLPKGFLDRTRERGLVVSSWAPQAQILSHNSTGGFLTHCGWNSTLESVANGVPLIVWPLYAEQKMNAVMLTEDIKVALRPKRVGSRVIGREEIGNTVRSLMEGEEGKKVRYRMKELKDAAKKVLSKDGSSSRALSEVVQKWKDQKV
uniref:Glycosyltransferase n=1 Tax=Linum usitatissimum TaxID=4006 RepID=I2BH20_LINUS|nr:UDP-glycosyltransferase 1 [Linum usitatissimum]